MRLSFPTVMAVSGFALAGLVACSPSEDAPAETIEADTPPVEVVTEEVSAPEATEVEEAVTAEAAAEDEHDHGHEGEDHHEDGHDHGDAHDHDDEHAHDEDHDHADEHSHDHDHDHDHGVGEAHVHGAGEMAIALDGGSLSVSFESPLASFASFEHEPKTPEQEAELQGVRDAFMQVSGVIALNSEAGCTSTSQDVAFRHSGDHGSIMADYVFDCTAADSLNSAELQLFGAYPALETVNVIFLNGADQTAKKLTADDSSLSLN